VTSIVPNKSIVVGRVSAVAGDKITISVESSKPAFPRAADLVAGKATIDVVAAAAVGDLVELECALEPIGLAGVGFVASRVVKRG
jgi:hypothetical protein